MNRRTKEISQELSLQAERWCYDNLAGPTPAEWNDKFHQKFAELIVKECIQVSEAHARDLESQPTDPLLEAYEDGVINGIYEATVAIKEHFGVEE